MVNHKQLSTKFVPAEAAKSDLLPAGDYVIQVPPLKEEFGKDGDSVKYTGAAKIIGPVGCPSLGRTVFLQFVMEHKSGITQKIGRRLYALLIKACGKDDIDDSDEIMGQRVWVSVVIKPESADGQFPARNEIRMFRPFVAGATTPSTVTAPTTRPKAPTPAPAPAPAQQATDSEIPF